MEIAQITTQDLAQQHEVSVETVQYICEQLGHTINGTVPDNVRQEFEQYQVVIRSGKAPQDAIATVVDSRPKTSKPNKGKAPRSAPSNGSQKSEALSVRQQRKDEAKQELVQARKNLTKANITAGRKEGVDLADQKAGAMVDGFLGRSKNNLEAMTQAIEHTTEVLIEVGSEAYLEEAEADDDPELEGNGWATLPAASIL